MISVHSRRPPKGSFQLPLSSFLTPGGGGGGEALTVAAADKAATDAVGQKKGHSQQWCNAQGFHVWCPSKYLTKSYTLALGVGEKRFALTVGNFS